MAFGLASLLLDVKPKAHRLVDGGPDEWKHLVLVLDVKPEAVVTGPDGFYRVRYDLLDVAFEPVV